MVRARNNDAAEVVPELSERAPKPSADGAATYDAFISYSHAADGALAPSLRNGLQRFATPWRVFGLTNPIRSLQIFQDHASLAANPALWPTIESALSSAQWFILLASPEAAQSPWVAKEVEYWRSNKDPAKLLIVQTDGEIAWDPQANDFDLTQTTTLPRQLAGAYPHEPRWIDARWARTGAQTTLRDPRFRDLVAELAAPLRGVPKDELIGEDIRQMRRLNRARNAGFAGLSTLAVGLAVAAWIAFVQRNDVLESRSRALATLADMESERGSPATAVRIALTAMGSPTRSGYLPEAEGHSFAHWSVTGRSCASTGATTATRRW